MKQKNNVIGPESVVLNKSVVDDSTTVEVIDEEILRKKEKKKVAFGQVSVGALFIILWEVLTSIGLLDSYYWSSPTTILQTGWVALTEGTLLIDLGYTSAATIIGFVLGTIVGAGLGLSFWWSPFYSKIAEPYLVAFNSVPKLALAPVLVILLGIGFTSKVMLAFLMVVIVTALAAYSGVKAIDPDMEKLLYSLGAKKRQVFVKVVIPSSMPWIISSLKINIALALAGAIVGEFIASRYGVGRMILYAGQIMDTNLVWVGVVTLSLLSIVMYLATIYVEKLLSKGMNVNR